MLWTDERLKKALYSADEWPKVEALVIAVRNEYEAKIESMSAYIAVLRAQNATLIQDLNDSR